MLQKQKGTQAVGRKWAAGWKRRGRWSRRKITPLDKWPSRRMPALVDLDSLGAGCQERSLDQPSQWEARTLFWGKGSKLSKEVHLNRQQNERRGSQIAFVIDARPHISYSGWGCLPRQNTGLCSLEASRDVWTFQDLNPQSKWSVHASLPMWKKLVLE